MESSAPLSEASSQLLAQLAAIAEEGKDDHAIEMKASGGANSILKRARAAEAQVEALKTQLAELLKGNQSTGPSASSASALLSGASRAAVGGAGGAVKGRPLVGVSPLEFKKLQKKAKDLEDQLAKAAGGGGVDKKALEALEKKHAKQIKDLEATNKKSSKALEDKLARLTSDHAGAAEKIGALTTELAAHQSKVKEMTGLLSEMESLKTKANQLVELKEQLELSAANYSILSEQFKKENALRKKYKNELEDIKGAIRVVRNISFHLARCNLFYFILFLLQYARCRPMAKYEIERGCTQVVKFPDESTLKVFNRPRSFFKTFFHLH